VLSPKVGGIVREVLVEDNQAVKAGQLLARIDERDYEAAAASARAEVAGAEAQLDYARATLQRQQSVIEQATTLVDANQAEDKLAQQELARSQYLAGQGAGSVQNAQQAQSRFDVSRARLAQNRAVRVGALVAPGASLMAVVPLKRSFVVANLQETQLTRVRQGQRASIAIDAYPGVLLHGTVHSIAPATGVTFAAIAPENATGNFTKVVQRIPVKIELDANQELENCLRVGMSAEVRIDTAMRRQELKQVSAR